MKSAPRRASRRTVLALFLATLALTPACTRLSFLLAAGARNAEHLVRSPARVDNKIKDPRRPDARLAALWVGHATVLVQMGERFVLTDPIFTDTAGQLAKRIVEPGIEPSALPLLDLVLISHMHFDHLSVGTLELLEPKIRLLVTPAQGLVYVPKSRFRAVEVPWWTTLAEGDLRVTGAPVKHTGYRYGADLAWMTRSFTGYVVEHDGMTVYFGGDTAYDREAFLATRERFPNIDLALLPIAPIHPREVMKSKHMDPDEAVQAYLDLGAKWMIPIHYGTFFNSTDEAGEALARLEAAVSREGLTEDQVVVLGIGEQRVLVSR